VLLPGLECVQPDQDALGREERALAHPVGPEDGVLLGTDRAGMLERLRISHRTSSLGPRRLAGAGRRYTPRAMAKSLDDLVREALAEVEEVSPEEVRRLLDAPDREGWRIIDVREGEEYAAGHIPGA